MTVGEWDEAAAVFHDAYERDGLGSDDITHIVFARLVALRGDLDATRQLLDAGLGRFRDSEDPQDLCAVRLIDALQAAAIGDDAGALDHAQAAAGYERDLGVRAESIRWAWPLAARSARNVGDGATEQKLLDGLDQHPLGKLPLVLRAERDLVRARLTAQSDDVEAARLFDQAIEAYRKIRRRSTSPTHCSTMPGSLGRTAIEPAQRQPSPKLRASPIDWAPSHSPDGPR